MELTVKSKGFCSNCFVNPGTKKCASCQIARYCSIQCQKQAWARHKSYCNDMALIAENQNQRILSKLKYETMVHMVNLYIIENLNKLGAVNDEIYLNRLEELLTKTLIVRINNLKFFDCDYREIPEEYYEVTTIDPDKLTSDLIFSSISREDTFITSYRYLGSQIFYMCKKDDIREEVREMLTSQPLDKK